MSDRDINAAVNISKGILLDRQGITPIGDDARPKSRAVVWEMIGNGMISTTAGNQRFGHGNAVNRHYKQEGRGK